ncbi:hypothetical protein H0H93_013575 [Arthromyces matolae]|nr:hypothetical protein H0H93_013575 [Arthromyces matolae]
MSFATAKDWAEAHIPNLTICDVDITPIAIEECQDRMVPHPNLEIIPVFTETKAWVLFVTHAIDDPAATQVRFKKFRESDSDKAFKEKYFSSEAAAGTVEFATVFNPNNM